MILDKVEYKLNALSKVYFNLLYSNILVDGKLYSKSRIGENN